MKLKFCVACGCADADKLHHHHLVARGDGGPDTDDNVITLCVECHGKIHGVVWRNNHKMLIRDGLKRAKARGVQGGRPRTDKATEAAIRGALRKGDAGMHKIAAAFGVGTGTVQRIKGAVQAPSRRGRPRPCGHRRRATGGRRNVAAGHRSGTKPTRRPYSDRAGEWL
jgi:HNH endonuclease